MKRLLIAPAVALALLTLAAPASAQSADLHTELLTLRREGNKHRIAVAHIQRRNDHCETPDPEEVLALKISANELSRQAGAIAPQVAARDHVIALSIAEQAETDFWHLTLLAPPDICYVPPAE